MKLIEIPGDKLGKPINSDLPVETRNGRAYDSQNIHITLKQWRMLHAVVDHDGFTAAAECLHVSQSAISYTIAKLQEQLGLTLIKVEGRKAHLTDQGRALLERSRAILQAAIELEALAESMRLGQESELRLMVDHDCPRRFIMAALREFNTNVPKVRVLLLECTGDQMQQAIRENTVDLAISVQLPAGLVGDKLLTVEYVPVAHPHHQLCQADQKLTAADLARHVQVVVGAGPNPPLSRFRRMPMQQHQTRTWYVSSIDTALAALSECLGYAWLPKEQVQTQVEKGELCELQVPSAYNGTKNFYLVHPGCDSLNTRVKTLSTLLQFHAGVHLRT
jgi:DNA-binding transcriptional LysR family regulator